MLDFGKLLQGLVSFSYSMLVCVCVSMKRHVFLFIHFSYFDCFFYHIRKSLNSISRKLKELILASVAPGDSISDYDLIVTGHSLG